ncbi:MAG: UvrD-helicase domain-containing protein, partial [Desulfobaccales bacterium]
EVHIAGGYDGEYGKISLFTPEERRRLQGQGAFFSLPAAVPAIPPPTAQESTPAFDHKFSEADPTENSQQKAENHPLGDYLLDPLNKAQRQAVTYTGPALVVVAGPGTGKTRALTHRLAYLLCRRGVLPQEILAVTFTRQAAGEMAERLQLLLPDFPAWSASPSRPSMPWAIKSCQRQQVATARWPRRTSATTSSGRRPGSIS